MKNLCSLVAVRRTENSRVGDRWGDMKNIGVETNRKLIIWTKPSFILIWLYWKFKQTIKVFVKIFYFYMIKNIGSSSCWLGKVCCCQRAKNIFFTGGFSIHLSPTLQQKVVHNDIKILINSILSKKMHKILRDQKSLHRLLSEVTHYNIKLLTKNSA